MRSRRFRLSAAGKDKVPFATETFAVIEKLRTGRLSIIVRCADVIPSRLPPSRSRWSSYTHRGLTRERALFASSYDHAA